MAAGPGRGRRRRADHGTLTVLLLVGLGVLAQVFDLDVVLGAFAAGFILRRAMPARRRAPREKLDGIAFGLLIPIFFVTSGMAIDPRAVAASPSPWCCSSA